MFAKQFYWYKLRGLFSSPFVSYWVHIDCLAPGYLMGAGNPTISRETETQVPAACQPQPRQPHRESGPSQVPRSQSRAQSPSAEGRVGLFLPQALHTHH